MKIIIFLIICTLSSLFFGLFSDNTVQNIYSQQMNETSFTNLNDFIINIREISSITDKNLIALLSSENGVQVKKVDLSGAVIQLGQEDSFSPNKMIDVEITMNEPVEPGSEIYACVIELGTDSYSQSIKCNIAYSSPTLSGEPQRIIVPL
jgi:hypothetical protein